MRISVAVVYRGSKKPCVQIELTPTAARKVLDGHKNTIENMCVDIEKALKWVTENA